MNRFFLLVTILILMPPFAKAQTNYLNIGPDIILPKDSVVSARLIADLDSFLLASQHENGETKWILQSEKPETEIIIGELRDISKKQKTDPSLEPYLTNVAPVENGKYLVQFSYLGIKDNKPLLQASFEIIATNINNSFVFSSILVKNTNKWKVRSEHYITVYYQDTIENFISQYIKYIKEFNSKFNLSKLSSYYFCSNCETLPQLLALSGIQYQLDYNGFVWSMTNFETPEKNINLYTKQFYKRPIDPHDIFHGCAASAIPEGKRNHYMICGCAYIYGGSWGISWYDIQKMFKSRMPYDNNTDWLKLYFERYNFGESKEKHLLITQFINALIIQKIEKEQGFPSVVKLLGSGNMNKDRINFFKILEETTGINERNFNRRVGELINDAMKNI